MAKRTTTLNLKNSISDIKLKNLLLPGIIILIVIALGLLKNQFVVATVNGRPITRLELIKDLEKKQGKATLDSLITEQLILQEAKARKVQVTQKDLDEELSKIEKSITEQGQKLDDLLSAQGMTRQDLTQQIKIQLILKSLVGKVEITQKEIDDYIEKNKETIPDDANMDDLKKQTKQQLENQKINDKIQAFIADLQKKAKIEYLLPL